MQVAQCKIKLTGFAWRSVPIVVAPIDEGDWCAGEIINGKLIQAGDTDGIELAKPRRIAEPERTHAAMLAEKVAFVLCAESIFSQINLPSQQAE